MNSPLSRRDMLRSSMALAALAFAQNPLTALGLEKPSSDETLIPFLDEQPVGKMLHWEQLTSWLTPNAQVFSVSHYNTPELAPEKWRLEISGLVKKTKAFSLSRIKARKRKTVTATLECSGNSSSPGFVP